MGQHREPAVAASRFAEEHMPSLPSRADEFTVGGYGLSRYQGKKLYGASERPVFR